MTQQAGVHKVGLGPADGLAERVTRPRPQPVDQKHRFQQFGVSLHRGSRQISPVRERRGHELLAAEGGKPAQHRTRRAGLVDPGHGTDIALRHRLDVPAKPRRTNTRGAHVLNLGKPAPHHGVEVLRARGRHWAPRKL